MTKNCIGICNYNLYNQSIPRSECSYQHMWIIQLYRSPDIHAPCYFVIKYFISELFTDHSQALLITWHDQITDLGWLVPRSCTGYSVVSNKEMTTKYLFVFIFTHAMLLFKTHFNAKECVEEWTHTRTQRLMVGNKKANFRFTKVFLLNEKKQHAYIPFSANTKMSMCKKLIFI